jgi:hypothetical protein
VTRTDGELIRDALDHLGVLRLHIERADLADQTVADAVSLNSHPRSNRWLPARLR